MKSVNKNLKKIEKMFDEISNDYDFLNNMISFYTHFFIKTKAINLLDIKNDSRILDLCSGSGDLGRIIIKKYPNSKITGIDFSSEMINIAKRKNPKIQYLKMDATKLDFENNYFDFVVAGFGLRNIENKELSLKEIYRVLKEGGYFLHLDFGKRNLISKIYDKIIFLMLNFFPHKDSYQYLINSKNEFEEPEELIEIFKNAGFKKVLLKYFLFNNISAQIMQK